MKMIIIILIILAVFSFVWSMAAFRVEGAEIHGNMQFGYIPELEGFEAEINVQFLPWYWLELYAGINVLMEYSGQRTSFYPFNDRYSVGVKANITDFLYVDIYHHCAHPVYSEYNVFYDRFAGGNKTSMSIGIEW